jgi:hypothetical protein
MTASGTLRTAITIATVTLQHDQAARDKARLTSPRDVYDLAQLNYLRAQQQLEDLRAQAEREFLDL